MLTFLRKIAVSSAGFKRDIKLASPAKGYVLFGVKILSTLAIFFTSTNFNLVLAQNHEQSTIEQATGETRKPASPINVEKLSLDIDALLTPFVESNNYAGNVLVGDGEKIIFSQSYGKMDSGRDLNNHPETRFFLCSGSMIFTSVAIMKLVDDGKLSLDDQLSKFLPDFKRANEITIHHMLAQRSGIPAIGSGAGMRDVLLMNYLQKPHSAEDLIKYIRNYNLLFDPGQEYNHGKSEYNILVFIIEKVSGMSFGEYLDKNIFEPLGMNNSGHFGKDADHIQNLASGHARKGFADLQYARRIHWSAKTGHASIYSTTGDLYKFAAAVLKGDLLSVWAWNMTFTDFGSSWGYGWGVSPQNGHKRRLITGRSPGFSSYFGIYPDENLIVVMLSNIYISLPYFVGPSIADIAMGESYDLLNLSTDPIDADFARELTGLYKIGDFYRPGGNVKITFKNGILYSDGNALIPVKEDARITNFIHRHYWSTLTFQQNEVGEYDQLRFDDYIGQRSAAGFAGMTSRNFYYVIAGFLAVCILLNFFLRRFKSGSFRKVAK